MFSAQELYIQGRRNRYHHYGQGEFFWGAYLGNITACASVRSQCESLPHVLTSDLGRTSAKLMANSRSTPNQQRPLLEGFLREAEAFLPSPILYGIGEENKLATVGDY